jgi:Cu+-exporting ATPase
MSLASSEAYGQSAARVTTCYVLDVQGMTCEGCAAHVQKGLSKVSGVAEVKVNYAKSEASVCVKVGASVQGETLVQTVEKAGYKAKVKRRSESPIRRR